jgi:putative toxin-antitoxin system antitoxin component (TIGR02293 family)
MRHMAYSIGRLIGLRASEPTTLELASKVREGLAYRTLPEIANHAGFTLDEVASALGLARRTLDRRKRVGAIDPRTSEKLVRLARVATRAEQVLGSVEEMRRWLRAANRALGGASPMSVLDTDVGGEAVLDLLGRIEHGVYS